MGTANAGTANPENATTALFNPAGMSQLSGTTSFWCGGSGY